MSRRKQIPERVRLKLWEGAGRKCEWCSREVIRLGEVEKASLMINVWEGHECWSCGEDGRVIVPCSIPEEWSWLAEEIVGRFLNRRYPSFRKGYSKSLWGHRYINHCPACGAVQGNLLIAHWLRGIEEDNARPSRIIECQIDLPKCSDGELKDQIPFHIHHIDRNPSNNEPENLMVLCQACHGEMHRGRRCPGNTRLFDFLPAP